MAICEKKSQSGKPSDDCDNPYEELIKLTKKEEIIVKLQTIVNQLPIARNIPNIVYTTKSIFRD